MTKIDIFSGFLGAGKTTLIKKLIAEAYQGERLVLIENEFGEIGIDGGFLADAGIVVNEMNSGCICCSLVGDFGEALKKVLREYAPDRILIEPSGVGKLSDVVRAVRDIGAADLDLSALVTVADAKKCRMHMRNFGEFFNDQIAHAGAIVLSYTKGLTEAQLHAAVDALREQNENAVIVTTDWDALSGAQLLDAITGADTLAAELGRLAAEELCPTCGHPHAHHHHDEECHCESHEHHHHHDEDCHCHEHHHHHDEECHCHEHHHHHHADEVFISCGGETAKHFERAALLEALGALDDTAAYGTVLRAKGIVAGEGDTWLHFDYVPGEGDVREGGAAIIGRLCVIGANLNIPALSTLFGVALK